MTSFSHNAPSSRSGLRKFGTYSYLPPLSAADVDSEIAHMLGQGWVCAIEHAEPERATATYWYLWRLPLFGADGVADVRAEIEACAAAHPDHHVRLMALDAGRQTQGQAIVVRRAGTA